MPEAVLSRQPPAGARPIPCFLADLEGRLHGRARWRRDVLAEVEDGLLCAAQQQMDAGADPVRAQWSAVARWGEVADIAADYNRNVARLTARQLNRYALLLTPALAIAWASVIRYGPPGPWHHRPMVVTVGLVLMACGGVLALGGGVLSERAGRGVHSVRGPGGAVLAGALVAGHGMLLAIVTSIAMLANRGIPHPESLSWPLVAVAVTLSLGTLARVTALMRRLRVVAPSPSRCQSNHWQPNHWQPSR